MEERTHGNLTADCKLYVVLNWGIVSSFRKWGNIVYTLVIHTCSILW